LLIAAQFIMLCRLTNSIFANQFEFPARFKDDSQQQMDEKTLADTLKPGDEITTILDRTYIVGAVHPDERCPEQFWIEPQGADEYDWWIPLSKIVRINGKDVQKISAANPPTSQI
jgi:hypothetical protein